MLYKAYKSIYYKALSGKKTSYLMQMKLYVIDNNNNISRQLTCNVPVNKIFSSCCYQNLSIITQKYDELGKPKITIRNKVHLISSTSLQNNKKINSTFNYFLAKLNFIR